MLKQMRIIDRFSSSGVCWSNVLLYSSFRLSHDIAEFQKGSDRGKGSWKKGHSLEGWMVGHDTILGIFFGA
jgi:hypothetical protein